jgi:hypothetical protein
MKRGVTGILWALVVMWVGSYVTTFMDVTGALTLPFGGVVAGLVIIDPTGQIWGKPMAFQSVMRPAKASQPTGSELAHQA